MFFTFVSISYCNDCAGGSHSFYFSYRGFFDIAKKLLVGCGFLLFRRWKISESGFDRYGTLKTKGKRSMVSDFNTRHYDQSYPFNPDSFDANIRYFHL